MQKVHLSRPQSILEQRCRAFPVQERLPSVVAWELNRLIKGPSLWDTKQFGQVSMSDEMKSLAESDSSQVASVHRLNRLLIEAAYPGELVELARSRRFDAAELNPAHAGHIALSQLAQDMAVNMYTALWSLMLTVAVTIVVSMFTLPKPEGDLKDLVYGLTDIPDEGPCPWYERPVFWATIVAIVLVAVNIIFW